MPEVPVPSLALHPACLDTLIQGALMMSALMTTKAGGHQCINCNLLPVYYSSMASMLLGY